MSSSIRLCAAICADHFDKKILKIWRINDGARVKILKNVVALANRAV
jgi:hypothetical protein